jgi:hypothetical protein
MAARVEHVAAGKVQRQRQAEGLAGADFARALQDLFFGDEVQAAELVVGPEVAPVGAFGPVFSSAACRLPLQEVDDRAGEDFRLFPVRDMGGVHLDIARAGNGGGQLAALGRGWRPGRACC